MADLAHLRPFPKGVSGNPGGKPKIAAFRKALKRVYLAKVETSHVSDMRGKTARLDELLRICYEKAVLLVNNCKDVHEFMVMTEFLQFLMDSMDGKEFVPKDGATATKENKTYLIGGEVVKREEVQTITQTAEITGSQSEE